MFINADRNNRFRADADKFIVKATGRRRALADEWIAASIVFDTNGQHIYADKAIHNALCVACGSVPMKRVPITLAESWS